MSVMQYVFSSQNLLPLLVSNLQAASLWQHTYSWTLPHHDDLMIVKVVLPVFPALAKFLQLTMQRFTLFSTVVMPTVDSNPSNATAMEHMDVTFTCQFSGIPAPVIEWEREGRIPLPWLRSVTRGGLRRIDMHNLFFVSTFCLTADMMKWRRFLWAGVDRYQISIALTGSRQLRVHSMAKMFWWLIWPLQSIY